MLLERFLVLHFQNLTQAIAKPLAAGAGMEEHQLKELAYTIFFGACGKRSNAEHVQVMRAQLEVSSSYKSLKRRAAPALLCCTCLP